MFSFQNKSSSKTLQIQSKITITILQFKVITIFFILHSVNSATLSVPVQAQSPSTSCPNWGQPTVSCHPITIIVSFDGFRYDYLQKVGVSTPNLDALKSSGTWAAYLRNQFPTKTFPNHQSLVTGLFPESHGVVDNSFYDPKYLQELTVEDERFWVFREDILPIWVVNQLVDPDTRFSGSMMWPGSCHAYGQGHKQANQPTYCVDYKPSMNFTSRINTALSWLTSPTAPANLILLYFEEPDELAHAFGPESSEVLQAIEIVDNTTGYLVSQLRSLGLYEHVNFLVLSDHGFVQVEQSKIIDLDFPAYGINTTLFTHSGGSPTYQILPKSGQKDTVYNQLKEAQQTHNLNYSVYLREELAIVKEHWHYSSNRRIGEIFLIADLGWVFGDFLGPNGKMAYWDQKYNRTHTPSIVYGTHGYDNHYQIMHPFFIAHGPSFWGDGREVEPFDSVSIFNLMCKLLQVPESHVPGNNGTNSTNNNGSPNPLQQLLSDQEESSNFGLMVGANGKESQRKKLQIVGFAVVGALVIGTIISVYIFISIGRDCGKKREIRGNGGRKYVRLHVSKRGERKCTTNELTQGTAININHNFGDTHENEEEKSLLLRRFSLSSEDEDNEWQQTKLQSSSSAFV